MRTRVLTVLSLIGSLGACQFFLEFGTDTTVVVATEADASADVSLDTGARRDAVTLGVYPGTLAVAIGPSAIYWSGETTDAGGIWMKSRDGGAPRVVLAGASPIPHELAARTDGVVYGREYNCELEFFLVGPAAPKRIGSIVNACGRVVQRLSGNESYLAAIAIHPGNRTAVYRVTTTGVEQLLDRLVSDADYTAVVVAGADVYVADARARRVFLAKGAGSTVEIAVEADRVNDLAAEGRVLYWITETGAVKRLDMNAGAEEPTPLATGLGVLNRLAVRNDVVYVTEGTGNGGHVWRIGPDKAREVLAKVEGLPFDIAADGERIVWSNTALDTIDELILN